MGLSAAASPGRVPVSETRALHGVASLYSAATLKLVRCQPAPGE